MSIKVLLYVTPFSFGLEGGIYEVKKGKHSILFSNPVYIMSSASIVGPKEGEGPLKDYFDVIRPLHSNNPQSYQHHV